MAAEVIPNQSEQIGALAAALSRAQARIEGAKKDTEGQVGKMKRKYADLASCWDACREAMASEELAVAQLPQIDSNGPILETVLTHSSGQWMVSRIPLVYGSSEALTPMQCMGSALTYARRYGLCAMLGICPEDDDGAGSGHVERSGGYAARNGNGHATPPPAPRPQSNGNGNGQQGWDKAPRSGKALFAWTRDQEKAGAEGLLKRINEWGKKKGFPDKMIDWSEDQVSLGHKAAVHVMSQAAVAATAHDDAAGDVEGNIRQVYGEGADDDRFD